VRLSWSDPNGARHAEIGILENLSISGMGLFLGVNVPHASAIKIVANDAFLTGSVLSCEFRENGYVVGVELDAESKWAQQPNSGFLPEHLLDISLLELE
jgi:hypothetical protein